MNNSLRFIQPSKILRDFIANYYLVELSGNPSSKGLEQKPVSNGCVEMFIGYCNTKGTCHTNTGKIVNFDSAIVGPHDLKNTVKAFALEHEPKIFKFVAINFKPDGFYKIFKIPSSALYNDFFDIHDVLGPSINMVKEQLENAKNDIERKRFLDSFFINHLRRGSYKHYNIKAGFEIARLIRHRIGNIRIGQLRKEFKITERTLQRDLKTAFGLSPKEYCKIMRFQGLFDFINNQHRINWLDMVTMFGYYDQAHLINEFKDATGITPNMFQNYRNKNVFKINNHLVVLNPTTISNNGNNGVFEAISCAEDSFLQCEKSGLVINET